MNEDRSLHGQITNAVKNSESTRNESLVSALTLFEHHRGRYAWVEQIGSGGMGTVWRGTDTRLDRTVALKRIHGKLLNQPVLLHRFRQEALTVAKLKHPNIVQVQDIVRDDVSPFLVMEWIDGEDLQTLLDQQGRFDIEEACRIVAIVAAALHSGHQQGVIHRDVKPSNIMLTSAGVPMLTDYGVAIVQESGADESREDTKSPRKTQTGTIIGSPIYMALEQILDAKNVSPASDLCSLGKTLYQLVTGVLPWQIRERLIPKLLLDVITTATADNPDERYFTLEQFREVVETLDHSATDKKPTQSVVDLSDDVAEATRQATLQNDELELAEDDGHVVQGESQHLWDDREAIDLDDCDSGMTLELAVPERPALLMAPFSQQDAAAAQQAWADHLGIDVEITNSVGMQFRVLPPGTFEMGATKNSNEEPVHAVTITEPKLIGVYPVTQGEWTKVMGRNPSKFQSVSGQDTSRFPVEQVSWEDCQEFLEKLNAEHPLAGWRYRLPTEAEWEYACRAGTTTAYSFGEDLNGREANVDGNYPYGTTKKGPYLQRPSVVGSYAANPFGLYDLHGNVWEWCSDWYGRDSYGSAPRENPQGPTSGSSRVLRGGSWFGYASDARSSYRYLYTPVNRNNLIGFRVVCE